MKCVACGDHPLNYIHCDRWDCPLLVARAKIEGLRALGYRQAVTAILAPQKLSTEDLKAAAKVCDEARRFAELHDPLWDLYEEEERFFGGESCLGDICDMPEEEREPDPPDEDDDEIAVDWDENGFWPSENDEAEEEC